MKRFNYRMACISSVIQTPIETISIRPTEILCVSILIGPKLTLGIIIFPMPNQKKKKNLQIYLFIESNRVHTTVLLIGPSKVEPFVVVCRYISIIFIHWAFFKMKQIPQLDWLVPLGTENYEFFYFVSMSMSIRAAVVSPRTVRARMKFTLPVKQHCDYNCLWVINYFHSI